MTPEDLDHLIRTRRTSMLVDRERAVPADVVAGLCELATWAPNHKRTWPARFALVEGDGRSRLGNVIADAMAAAGDSPERVEKTRSKYLRTPASLVVGTAPGDSAVRSEENRDTTAAGIQNLLLAATARGLATYWSSCPRGANDAVVELCGFEPGTHITAIIYLGWEREPAANTPERPPIDLRLVH